jgi:hypothetical protein
MGSEYQRRMQCFYMFNFFLNRVLSLHDGVSAYQVHKNSITIVITNYHPIHTIPHFFDSSSHLKSPNVCIHLDQYQVMYSLNREHCSDRIAQYKTKPILHRCSITYELLIFYVGALVYS